MATGLLFLAGCESPKPSSSTSSAASSAPKTKAPTMRPEPTGRTAPQRPPAARRVTASGGSPPLAFTRRKDGGMLFAMRVPSAAKMSEIDHALFTPDGKLLVMATSKKVLLLWSVTSAGVNQVGEMSLSGSVEQMRVSPDGRWLAMTGIKSIRETEGGGSGSRRYSKRRTWLRFESFVAVVDLKKRLTLPDKWATNAKFKSPSFTADSKHLVVLRVPTPDRRPPQLGGKPPVERPSEILAFETRRWSRAWLTQVNKRDLRTLAVWGDDTQVAYSDYNRLFVLDRTSRKTRPLRGKHRSGVDGLRVHRGAKLLLSSAHHFNRAPELVLWQMPAGRLKRRFHHGRRDDASGAAFFNHRYILGLANTPLPAVGYKPGTHRERGILRIWDISTGRLVKKITRLPLKVLTVAASTSGWIAIGGELIHKPGDSACRLLLYPPGTLLRL